MEVLPLKEQIAENTLLEVSALLLPYLSDGENVCYEVKRGPELNHSCLTLLRKGNDVFATGSYYVGVDWLCENEMAIEVFPKMNDREHYVEIDYLRMLEEALQEPENFKDLDDLVTIHFQKSLVPLANHHADFLSLFLITEYIQVLKAIVAKGLKKSYYEVEENLKNKVKGKILSSKNVVKNLSRGYITFNECRYQVYDVNTPENRILKKAMRFCEQQLKVVYSHGTDIRPIQRRITQLKPHFVGVGDLVEIKEIQKIKSNPLFKEYKQALHLAQLILRRYGYDLTMASKQQLKTPPFWVDCSKLFELYVFSKLRRVFTEPKELVYHKKMSKLEPDYMLHAKEWSENYIIDAKYKPAYKDIGILKEDAWQVAGYARLHSVYKYFELNEDIALPIKCLIIYPDQNKSENFTFTRWNEPKFDKISNYVRMYKVGIRLPEIEIKCKDGNFRST